MSKVKDTLVRFLRKKYFQPLWQLLFHISKIGMNYWGGASLLYSGEISVTRYVYSKLKDKVQPIVFDVGANRGQYAFEVASVFKGVSLYSFEPSAYTYGLLIKNLEERKLIDYVKAFKLGFGQEEGIQRLYFQEPGTPVASLYKTDHANFASKSYQSEDIVIESIDSFCHRNGIHEIDLLKLDIEGHEYFALCGATTMLNNHKIRFIQFEFGEFHIDSRTFFKDFYELLSTHYNLYRIVSDGLVPIKTYTPELEVFATANYMAELKQYP